MTIFVCMDWMRTTAPSVTGTMTSAGTERIGMTVSSAAAPGTTGMDITAAIMNGMIEEQSDKIIEE